MESLNNIITDVNIRMKVEIIRNKDFKPHPISINAEKESRKYQKFLT